METAPSCRLPVEPLSGSQERGEAQRQVELEAVLAVLEVEAGRAVYIPFGTDWYGYFMRRLAERPANVAFFLRALVKRLGELVRRSPDPCAVAIRQLRTCCYRVPVVQMMLSGVREDF